MCPNCGSDDVYHPHLHPIEDRSCNECGAEWECPDNEDDGVDVEDSFPGFDREED